MKILSIETSTMLGGVAIVDKDAGLIAETRLNVKTTHSERLMTAVHNTLVQSEIGMDDIDVFAVAIGPGSFTGLRIGLSTVKGLSYATGKPVVTVPTLEAFAWNFPFSGYPVCLMLDARKKEVYSAIFIWKDTGFMKVVDEISVKPADLLKGLKGSIIFAGEGVLLYRNLIEEILKERAIFAPSDKMVPSPANVALIGLAKALKGEFADTSEAVPFYIRKSEAEVKWLEKN
ncbi:MAG: tRNA (adenosine(37)-N6)-threonylcarbamoyltransferase complex dimerization subunit type 1 TsaB [Nitrospirota bacterium]